MWAGRTPCVDIKQDLSSSTMAVRAAKFRGMPGHIGMMADAAWIHSVRAHLAGDHYLSQDNVPLAVVRSGCILSDNRSYFIEDQNLLAVVEDRMNPFQLPSWQAAEMLSDAYFRSLHGTFRFVDYASYLQDLRKLYEKPSVVIATLWHLRSFLALSNIMWATGARWLQLLNLDPQVNSIVGTVVLEGHLSHYARARALGLDHRMQIDHPSIVILQGMAVLALYLLHNGSINRSSSLVAQTVRHATSLGIHLHAAPGVLPDPELKSRAQLWWSIFRLEIMLSEITGRPKCLRGAEVNTPFISLLADIQNGSADVDPVKDRPHLEDDLSHFWSTFHCHLVDVKVLPDNEQGLWESVTTRGPEMSLPHFVAALELSGPLANGGLPTIGFHRLASTDYNPCNNISWRDTSSKPLSPRSL